jgi:predicted dehydrogenase
MIHNDLIGDVVSVQHLEPVGYWHQAHSYVRGNWRKSSESSFMLMTKSCHDLDWLRYIVGSRCIKISSFGNLKHFRKVNKPVAASDRCLDCCHNDECPYSATKIYLALAQRGSFSWPVDVITEDLSVDGVKEALRTGPYGRCVYECDNDVVDHQVVNMLFENGSTASFTMTAFDFVGQRRTCIFGTKGCIQGNGENIEYLDFRNGHKSAIEIGISDDGTLRTGHGGGDYELIKSFIWAVAQNDHSKIYSGPEETLETHLSVFAAERSRLESRVLCYTSEGWE